MDGLTLTTDDAFTIHSLLTGTDSNPISVGAGKGITTINPYMTAEVAETVFAKIDGKTMRPCTVKWRGNPAVEAGDIVSVIGGSGENLTAYVMELKTQIKGGMSADLTCYGPSDTDYATPSPSEQKFKRMYEDVVKSFQDATQKIIGSQGGYFEITYNKDGYPTGWTLRNTPTVEDNTKMWIMSIGGLGFSKDGGKTISNVALTMDGTINGGALAIGSVKQDAVSGLSQQLTAIDGELKSKISRDDATSEIEQTANELNVRITGLNDNLQLVTKTYQVGDDGLVIGEAGNPIRLKLANDTLQFLRDNVAELEITADGVLTKRITTDALIIGNVIFKKDDVGDVTIY